MRQESVAPTGRTELPGRPDPDLIAAQYAGRPQLRAVLDAVLAALPALGAVTVQARKTLVSVSMPRRVFAVGQATTRSRVDLGLRLDHERPGGRLLTARGHGAATVRIPPTGPGNVDAEVLGWLRRAHAENAPPPPPRHRSAPGAGDRVAHRGDRGIRPARAQLHAGRRRGAPPGSYRTVHHEQGAARTGRTG
jgi:Domain of unknown function (DUF5655)